MNTNYTYIDEVVDTIQYIAEKGSHNRRSVRINNYLARYYAMIVLIKGENITLKDVHDAWAMNQNYSPVGYGHEHKSIVPFEELSKETQDKDEIFVQILKEVVRVLKNK